MAVYVVTYDLRAPNKNYDGLIKLIESYTDRKKFLLSAYFINTIETSTQIFNKLSPALDGNDHLIVMKITSDYYGRLEQSVWDWLKARF